LSRPNILIVVIDSLRADHVGCYGYRRPTTPNIDRIAAEGCLFETCITAAPFSPASYASMFSNLYPHQHGVNGDTVRVWPDAWPRLPQLMRERGYYTFGVSNNAFVSAEMNATRGFDAFLGLQEGWVLRQYNRILGRVRRSLGYPVANRLEINRLLCKTKGDSRGALRAVAGFMRAATRPFFGFVILMDPHAPYGADRRAFSRSPAHVREFLRRINGREMWPRMMAYRRTLPQETLDAAMDLYDGEVLHADRCLGETYRWLRQAGLLDDTVLAVAADHGEAFGEHGVWGHGFALNDCLTRVPLVLRCPALWPPGARCDALVQLHDLHEMCLNVASYGDPRPREHGNCLTRGSDPSWRGRDFVFSQFPPQAGTLGFFRETNADFRPGTWERDMWAVRSRDWRYVEYDDGAFELYDLRADRNETTSVANDHPAVCREFRDRLAQHRLDRPRDRDSLDPPPEVDEVVLERLRALGYVE